MDTSEFKEGLRAVPDEMRSAKEEAENALERTVAERPALDWALDARIVLVAGAVAVLVAFVLRRIGLGFTPTLLLFVVLFAGLWVQLSRAASSRRPTRPR